MTEQMLPTNGAEPRTFSGLADAIVERLQPALERMSGTFVERRVFDDRRHGDRTIITAASVSTWGGYGFGFGRGGRDADDGGGGGGIGGGGEGRPVAVIEVSDDGVRVRPVLDLTKIGLTVIAAVLTVWKALR
ncbi:MAG: hypothetical protein IT198_01575 [Acidimicrobiia bacterium]|nr:hypothetical protein [Acidimicrobiia bacterium]